MKLKSTALAITFAAGAALFALPTASAAPLTNCDVEAASLALSDEERGVLDTINVLRAENGVGAVTHAETLARPAEWASTDSAQRGASPADHVDTLGRDIATRFAQCGVPASSKIAEINFYGIGVEAADAIDFWWNSAGHKAIMLDGQLTRVGVAVIYEGDLRHWTVTFAQGGDAAPQQETTVYRNNLTGAEHQAEFDSLLGQGYRLVDITATDGPDPRYTSTWTLNDGRAWAARHGVDSKTYQAEFDSLLAQGYRLTQVRGYEVDGASRFVGIWEKNDGRAWEARHDITEDAFFATSNQMTANGYRLVHAHYYQIGNEQRVAAIWNK
ncbi:CAP domain-containing protein [Nocardia sp. NPDC127526]|uniref:CAP domain-containing protein n=1 Tax=Nocardia sp. NPDC127526 TaxID=3345393 RepID=UPI00362C9893